MAYFARVRRPAAVVSLMLAQVSTKVQKIAAWEHNPAHNERNVHCHIVLQGASVTVKQIQNLFHKVDKHLKGNDDWSFKQYDPTKNPYIYCSQGNLDPFYVQNEDVEWIKQQKNLWVPPAQELDSWALRWIDFQRVAPNPEKSPARLVFWDDPEHPLFDTNSKSREALRRRYIDYPDEIPQPELKQAVKISFSEVVKSVYSYVWMINGGVQRPQAKNQRSCLIDTYCYHHNIEIPPVPQGKY